MCGGASKADQNWDGDNAVGNFSFNNNWFGDNQPGWGFGGSLHFSFRNNGGQTSLFYDYGAWVNTDNIIWDSTFNASLTLNGNGNGIDFNQKIENDSSSTQTVNIPTSGNKNGAGHIELNPVSGDLILQQAVFNDNASPYQVWGGNSKMLTIAADLVGGAAGKSGVSFTIEDVSKVKFTAAQTWGGSSSLNVNKGELWLDSGGALASGLTVNLGLADANTAKFWIADSSGGHTVGQSVTVANSGGTKVMGGLNTSGNNTFSGNITLNGGVQLTANDANGQVTFGGVISGGSGITATGPGTVVLSGNNTYGGVSTINGGVLSVSSLANGGATSGIGNSGSQAANLVLNGGTLKYTGAGANIDRLFSVGTSGGILDVSGGTLTLNNTGAMGFNSQTGARTLTLTGSGNGTLNTVIGDNGGATAVTKNGAGIWVLGGSTTANAYSGLTTVNAGTLNLGETASLTAAISGNLTISGGYVGYASAKDEQIADTSDVTISSGGLLMGGTARKETIHSLTMSGGSVTIGTGNMTLTTASSISGGTATITSSSGALTANANLTMNGGTIDLSSGATFNLRGGTGTGITYQNTATSAATINGGNISLNNASGAQTVFDVADVGAIATELTISSALTGGASGGMLKQGTGVLQLAGGSANTYSGATTVNVGELDLNKTAGIDAITAGALVIGDGTGGANADVVKLLAANQINNASAVTINSSGKLDLNGNNETIASLADAGAGGGNVNLGSGTLVVGDANNKTFSGVIAGSGGALTKQGAGQLTLSGANTYSGITTINAGILSVSSLANGGANSGIGNSGSLAVNLVLNGGTLQYTGTGASIDRLFSVGTSGGFLDVSGGTLTLNNTGAMGFNSQTGARTLTLTGSGNGTLAAVIGDNSGATALTKNGAGTWVLSGNNNNSGVTTISGGTLQIGAGSNSGSLGSGNVTDNATLAFNRSDAITYGGVISGTGALIQQGTGTLTLSATNTYSGGTGISNGTLAVVTFGAIAGNMQVANGATLNLQGGVTTGSLLTNLGTVIGFGGISNAVVNGNNGKIFALTNGANIGTLTVNEASTINGSTATIGTIGTNAVLNLLTPGATPFFVNNGTISISGGTILLNGAAGTITNNNIIAGVGNVSTLPIVTVGAGSFIAQAPISGLSNLIASVGVTNSGILGANNQINGAATLTLSTSTGGGLVNNGTIALLGGFMTLTNAAGANATLTNNTGIVYGFGTNNLVVNNQTTGTIMASNGVFVVGLENNRNAGVLTNFSSTSTLQVTNSILVNASTGKMFLNGGTMGAATGGSVTNQGTITGPGTEASSLYNDTTGFVAATNNGTVTIGTDAGASVVNLGTMNIANGSTLSNAPVAWNNTNGTVFMAGGTLTGGSVTNKGTITGAGTINSMVGIINAAAGTIKATNGVLAINSTTVSQSGTMIGGTASGTYLQMTNTSGPVVNNGTIVLDSPAAQINLALYVLQNFTNAAGGWVTGAGILRSADNVIGGSGANFNQANLGNILATNGTLIVDSGDGFSVGFNNAAGATVTVASASTFGIARSTNAWLNSGFAPVNNGVIILNGGTVATYTNVGTGTGATPVAIAANNATYGTISNSVTGVISGFGTLANNFINLGTVNATNGTLVSAGTAQFNQNGTLSIQQGGTFTTLQSTGSFANNGGLLMFGGTFVGTNMGSGFQISSSGSISGFGTINTGTATGSGGQNARIVNSGGTIIATNGTLFVNPGDAFSQGGFSNSASGKITIASGASFVLNRTSHAWGNDSAATNVANLGTITLAGGSWSNYAEGVADASRYVRNVGTIIGNGIFYGSVTNVGTIIASNGVLTVDGSSRFGQSGTLAILAGGTLALTNSTATAAISFTNGGSILMRGGELQAGVIANTNVIFGFGIISGGGVDNSGALLASNGVLTAALSSFTNGTTATIGTLTTNATLDVTVPGVGGQPLINRGTINMTGGTLLFNGSASGTISNRTTGTILGVGNVTQTVVNDGTVMAANPVSGLNIFSVGLSEINGATATLGASNNAVLNVVISGGAGSSFNNNGSITMLGGQLIISNGTPGVITNNAFVSGSGSITPEFVNNSNIVATVNGGTLRVSLYGGTNGVLGNLRTGQGATLVLSNSGVVNLGHIGADGLNGGTIAMVSSSGIITNRGTGVISGDSSTGGTGLSIDAFVHNEAGGLIVATNGVLRFNNINGLYNTNATILISSTGTFQSNSSNSWANAGTIDIRGGTLRTGGFTNAAVAAIFTNQGSGVISGYGTIIGGGAFDGSGAGFDKSIVNLGTIIATNPLSGTSQTLFITTASATELDGIRNLGTMIVSSNNTLSLNRDAGLPILNRGTITIQNGTLTGSGVLSNTLGGIIQGYGTLTHQIVNLAGGTIRATNGILTMTSTIFPVNQGTFEIDNGATMTWNTSNSWVNSGTVDMRGGTLRTGGWTNAATIAVFTNLNTITGFGTIYGGGSYNTNGIGIDKSIVNLGTVIANGGTLILDTGVATSQRGLANLNTMIIATTNDTLVLSRTAEFGPTFTNLNYLQNSGTIIINGGTLISRTSITNQNEGVGLPGLIQGFGHIALTNELVNLGTIRSTNTVAGGDGILHFVNPAGSALQIKQSGTLVVEGASEMIFGANTNAPLANNGTILMRGGILRSGTLTNAFGATFGGFGTITSSIINSGTGLATSLSAPLYLTGATVFNQTNGVLGANNGQLIVNTVFTNAGTVSFINSVGVFSNAVVNQGAWIMDPSTNVFYGNYTVASNGYVTMTSGDISIFKSNFVNQSRNSNSFNTVHGKFVFDGDAGSTQVFSVAGLNLGGYGSTMQASNETFFTTINGTFSTNSFLFGSTDPIFGFSNNFALGTLQIGSLNTTSTLMLVDAFPPGSSNYSNDNFVAGLYVQDLTLNAGSLLIISNNVQLYFMRTNGVTGVSLGVLNTGDNVLVLSGGTFGSFHQLAVVPEPSILMLLTLGGIAIVRHRRRSAARARQK